jgi:hypothetical protein
MLKQQNVKSHLLVIPTVIAICRTFFIHLGRPTQTCQVAKVLNQANPGAHARFDNLYFPCRGIWGDYEGLSKVELVSGLLLVLQAFTLSVRYALSAALEIGAPNRTHPLRSSPDETTLFT